MTAAQHIQSQDISVGDVFQKFYAVPNYQREYVWQTEHVEQLLQDINQERSDGSDHDLPEYFIGSIVVCPRSDDLLDLIDGQQRMTTLYVLLCAIRDMIAEAGESPPDAMRTQIAASYIDAQGQERHQHRLDLQYEDSGEVLEAIASGAGATNGAAQTSSIENIRNAYDVIWAFLNQDLSGDTAELRRFYGYVINKVKLIRIETEDVAKALKIFETINDRGSGLNSMDLLKNLLFIQANREQYDTLKDVWRTLQDKIFDMGEKPLRFLRYYVFSRYTVDALREDEIYSWFNRNAAAAGYKDDPVAFARELVEAARAYQNFLAGKDANGDANRHLQNLRLLGGKAARQHIILLLAGRHLSPPLFDRLCQEVENLFFCYVITREPTRDFERNFARWASDLRAVQTEEELEDFIGRTLDASRSKLADGFHDAMRRLTSDILQKYRLKYVLAKLTQFVDQQAYRDTEGTRWLSRYVSSDLQVEHILPQSPSEAAAEEFGPLSDDYTPYYLGNLVLVEGSINASLGNRPYSEKRPVYRESQLLLTRALAERPKVGANTRIDRAVENLKPFQDWNEQAVQDRQQLLADLACAVWDVPLRSASAE
jgi:uncharacterized protein with ParB-like and HNH nuclease domain